MKSPLLLPALALAIVGAILAGELHALLVDPPPRDAAWTGVDEPELPFSSQGRPRPPADVTLLVHHRVPGDPWTVDRDAPEHWYVSVLAAHGLGTAVTPVPIPVSAHELLRAQLRKIADACPKATSDPHCAEGILAIRASGDVPYHVVFGLIEDVACACFYRLEFAVHGPRQGSVEQRLGVPLPLPAHVWDLRVRLRRNVMTGACERGFEGVHPRPEPRPAAGPTFSCNAEGDARFRLFLEQWLADTGNGQYRPIGGLVEPTADVPLQAVVHLIDAFRSAGLEQISFGCAWRAR